MSPELQAWLSEPPPVDVGRALERLCRADDVVHVAVMPDVHLAEEVCVGVVVATTRLLGCAAALCSSSHGAGRAMSRQEARRRVRIADLDAQVAGVWYDHRKARKARRGGTRRLQGHHEGDARPGRARAHRAPAPAAAQLQGCVIVSWQRIMGRVSWRRRFGPPDTFPSQRRQALLKMWLN